MSYTPDRVEALERKLITVMQAVRNLGFNSEDSYDIQLLFAELRLLAWQAQSDLNREDAWTRVERLFGR
jgi:hypothetical protein